MDRYTASDHRAIQFDIGLKVGCSKGLKRVRKPESTDRLNFVKVLKEFLPSEPNRELKTTLKVEMRVTDVTTALLRAYKVSCPETVVNEQDIVPWWDDDLGSLKKKTRKAFNRYMRKKDSGSWEAYKASKREFKKLLRSRKRESWRSFCSSVEGT